MGPRDMSNTCRAKGCDRNEENKSSYELLHELLDMGRKLYARTDMRLPQKAKLYQSIIDTTVANQQSRTNGVLMEALCLQLHQEGLK